MEQKSVHRLVLFALLVVVVIATSLMAWFLERGPEQVEKQDNIARGPAALPEVVPEPLKVHRLADWQPTDTPPPNLPGPNAMDEPSEAADDEKARQVREQWLQAQELKWGGPTNPWTNTKLLDLLPAYEAQQLEARLEPLARALWDQDHEIGLSLPKSRTRLHSA